MLNLIPRKPSLIEARLVGTNKLRVVHSNLVDYDAESIVCYVYLVVQGETDYVANAISSKIVKVDKGEVNFFEVELPVASGTQEYIVEIAVLDQFAEGATGPGSGIILIDSEGTESTQVENELVTGRVASGLLISDPVRISTARGAYITSVLQTTPDSFSNSAPSYFQILIDNDNIEQVRIDNINVQVGVDYNEIDLTGITWTSVYNSILRNTITVDSGLDEGTDYVFRVITTFADGSTATAEYFDQDVDTTVVEHPLRAVTYAESGQAPDGFSGLAFQAFTAWDGTPTYDLLITWDWDGFNVDPELNNENYARNFEIEYIKDNSIINATDISSLSWTGARKFTVGSSADRYVLPAFEPLARYGFRIRSVGWGADELDSQGNNKKYSDWFYAKVSIGDDPTIDFDIIASDSTAPVGTNIQVTNAYIRAYTDWGGANQALTFQIDASTGDVSIGSNGEFFYDAGNAVLSIDGSAVINEITSASFVMDWLGGVAPSFRSANKTGYANGGSGIFMGYTAENVFQMDIGNDSAHMRWDGSDLTISGGVTIESPADPSTLNPGAIGYVTLALSTTNNIVLFNGSNNTLKSDPTIINATVATNGDATFISNLKWQIINSSSQDVTSSVLSEQFTGAPENAKKLTISSGNGILSSNDSLTIRVYHDPTGTTTWNTANIKDFSSIGKVNTFDNIVGVEDPFYAYLSNEAHPIPVDGSSQNPSLQDAGGVFKVYQGTTDLSSLTDTVYSITDADGCTVNIDQAGNYNVTAIPLDGGGVPTKDTFVVRLQAVHKKDPVDTTQWVTFTRDFSLFISKQGNPGDPGEPGDPAKALILSADSYVFRFDENDNPINPASSITFEVNSQNIGSLPTFTTSPNVNLTGTGISRALSISDFGNNETVIVTALAEGFTDSITITKIKDGDTGEPGVDGFTVVLTNESHTVPSDFSGNVSTYEGSGTDVIAYRGTTKLTPAINVGSLTNLDKDEYDVRFTNLLVGMSESIASGQIRVSDATGGMSTDTHQISYTVHIGTGGGEYLSLSKVQTLTKSKQGSIGDPGVPGDTGRRAPQFVEAATTDTNSAQWFVGGTGSEAYARLIEILGDAVPYDVLTLFLQTDPTITETMLWSGTGWQVASKFNGNIIAKGTIAAEAIVADEGFFNEMNVNRIYNHGGDQNSYNMMIDFENGAIHIRGGS